MDVREVHSFVFDSPCRVLVSGSSATGKSTLIHEIIKNKNVMFKEPPVKILYLYSYWQKLYDTMNTVEFRQGLAIKQNEFQNRSSDSEHLLIILDDLMKETVSSGTIESIFSGESHHKNISIFFINQNYYFPGKYSLTIRRNCTYKVFFRSENECEQLTQLDRQLHMGGKLIKAFEDIMQYNTHGYIMIDTSVSNDLGFKLKTNILPNQYMIAYG